LFDALTLSVVLRCVAAVALTIGSIELVYLALRYRRAKVEARTSLIEPWTHSKLAATKHHAEPVEDVQRDTTLTSQQREFIRRLRKLGIAARFAPAAFLTVRLGCVLLLAACGWILVAPSFGDTSAPRLFPVVLAGVAGALGWYLPTLAMRWAAQHRSAILVDGLPDALELLVICAEGGLSLGDGITRIVKQLERTRPELAEELALTAADLKILPDQDQALTRLAERIDAPIVQAVVTALVQTMRYGTPFAEAVRTTAAEIRNDSLIHLEERANELPTILTLPMIFFILPTIMLIIAGPAALKMMDVFTK
jgi:tight adherence protein C